MKRLFTILLVAEFLYIPASAQLFRTWNQYLGGADSAQYSALDQINESNVANLSVVWSYPTGEGSYRFNPIVIDGVMYVLAAANSIVALDAVTGKEIWIHRNQGAVGNRGVNFWQNQDGSDRRIFYINAGFLTAINARTGETIQSFGEKGRVDLRKGLNRDITNVRPLQTSNPGRIFENLIIIALPASGAGYTSTPGDIQAYDVRTGELRWVFHTVPEPGEFGADTWPAEILRDAGGVHNWSELTIDERRGIAYIPLGTPRFDFYGGNRHGQNLFGNSLLALNARTGERLWHYQLLHHDLWDYDLPTAPKLLTIRREGREVDVVAQATKWGYLYVFDRVTGEPIWPIQEVPVPQTDVPGEKTWPTQPIPSAPPPFARPSFSKGDVNPYLPETEQAALRARFRTLRDEGVFTPPSLQGSLRHAGGSNWGGAAIDPAKGTLYVVSQELPTVSTLKLPAAKTATPAAPNKNPDFIQYDSPLEFLFAKNGLAAVAPPWSRLTAYDLNAGTILWQVPNGGIAGLAVQPPGSAGSQTPRAGPLVTAGGLIFLGTSSDRKFRAYDQATGKVLWERDLDAAIEGVPATFEVNGTQYLAICVGAGNGTFPPRIGAQSAPGPGRYVVFALPAQPAKN
jgi:quinoprotein glucose dehydrogenase